MTCGTRNVVIERPGTYRFEPGRLLVAYHLEPPEMSA